MALSLKCLNGLNEHKIQDPEVIAGHAMPILMEQEENGGPVRCMKRLGVKAEKLACFPARSNSIALA